MEYLVKRAIASKFVFILIVGSHFFDEEVECREL
jgi:hypothetical protein